MRTWTKIMLAVLAVACGFVMLPILGGIIALLWNLLPPILLACIIVIAPILLIGVLIGKFIK